ncbi:aldose 1-epimerase [Sanguibacter sp. 25GB23B1]|uniref:aldose 1-epimerase n=1 Tax=unclassified Sanguibacter TaxID=2645534 RepID=UPI0032AFAA6F
MSPHQQGSSAHEVVLRAGEARLEVAFFGATVLRWLVPHDGELVDLVDGYRDAEEMRSQDGVRNGVMAPFCNRVSDARYVFDGVHHDLLPGSADRTIYHGLVRTEPFSLARLDQTDEMAVAVLRCGALAGGTAPGYPFEVDVEVEYRLGPTTLDVAITGTNVGAEVAPFASGWHPYFRLPGADDVDRLHLDVPATMAVRTDDRLLPLAAGRAFVAQDAVRWRPVGGAVVDAAFGGLQRVHGRASTTLTDPATGAGLVLHQDEGLVHVFTGDTLARGRRAAVAIEPVEAMTDAFNRPDCAEAIRLAPGEARSFRFSVGAHGLRR